MKIKTVKTKKAEKLTFEKAKEFWDDSLTRSYRTIPKLVRRYGNQSLKNWNVVAFTKKYIKNV